MAHLWATTLPTPPAPMRRTLFIGMLGLGVEKSGPAGKDFSGNTAEGRSFTGNFSVAWSFYQ
jgi:hypothetical protein